jgi:hypothetical protein
MLQGNNWGNKKGRLASIGPNAVNDYQYEESQ